MKKKLSVLVAAVATLGVMAFPAAPAMAKCNDGDSRARDLSGSPDPNAPDYNPNYGEPTGEDTLATDPAGRGTIVYGDASQSEMKGYIGVWGPTGYIELEGDQSSGVQVDGQTADGSVTGQVVVGSSPDVCVNDAP